MQTFSPALAVFSSFLTLSLKEQNFFKLHEVQFINLFFDGYCAFGVKTRTLHKAKKAWFFFFYIFFRSFLVLDFTVRSMLNSEFYIIHIYIILWKVQIEISIFTYVYLIALTPFLEKTCLLHRITFVSILKVRCSHMHDLFLDSIFCFTDKFIFVLVLQQLDYCSFTILEIR